MIRKPTMHKLLSALLVLACATEATAQRRIVDLHEAMAQGDVVIESVSGTGGSTGAVLHARLTNATAEQILIDVFLRAPLYLSNSGRGQNMIVTQLYERDGSYFRDDDNRRFVRLESGRRLPITLVALCVDFDRNNPTATEAFSVMAMPQRIEAVMQVVIEQQRQNPSADQMVAAQLALWVAQGHSLEEIEQKFEFTSLDVMQMEWLLRMIPHQQP